jgi:RimJ/RimL family protein N-acetyltransferase
LSVEEHTRPDVTLRAARDEDGDRLLEWRNDPESVRFSVSGRPVAPDEHIRWFTGVRDGRTNSRLWIAEKNGTAVGQVRVDAEGDTGTVSIAVAAGRRGQGLGTAILRAMLSEIAAGGSPHRLTAAVHCDNHASQRAFEAAGFRRRSEDGGFLALEWP